MRLPGFSFSHQQVRAVSIITALLSLGGMAVLINVGIDTSLSPWEQQWVVTDLGLWSFRLLLLSFAMSPLATALRRPWLRQCRRTFGLWAFAFAVAHVVFYMWLVDMWPDYLHILFIRPYLLCGTIAFLFLAALALTSPALVVQQIGPRTRSIVHRLLYAALPLLLLHETLYLQDSITEIVFHVIALVALFLARLLRVLRERGPLPIRRRISTEHGR